MEKFCESGDIIIKELSEAICHVDESEVKYAVKLIENSERVFFIGVGRVSLALQAMAKRFSHLGINAVVVGEITEPAITKKDLLVVGSGSGETGIPLFIASKAKEYGAKVLHIGAAEKCTMERYRDAFLCIPVSGKGKENLVSSSQPMTSLFEQSLFLLGDIIAYMLIKEKGIDMSGLWEHHANLE